MISSTRLLATARRWWLEIPPEWLFVLSFAALITFGTAGLLWLPGLYTGPRLDWVDALFTATSAACVTGLTVVDTATHFTRWGQAWILLIIQLGGLGLVGITSSIIGAMGQRLSLRTEMLMVPAIQQFRGRASTTLTGQIVKFTFGLELVTALVLFVLWLPQHGVADAAWHAAFHSVNAFCNAGFSTFSDSLVGAAGHPGILLTVSFTVVLGGMGYLSSLELAQWLKERRVNRNRRLSVHTYAAVLTNALLLAGGTAAFAWLEWDGVLEGMGPLDASVNAWFMSSTRTAGFTTVDYDEAGNGSILVTMFLMVVGGSPGSTAGGIKTTALAIMVALAWSRIRGRRFVQLYHRTVPDGTVQRTVSLVILFFVILAAVNALLTFGETADADIAIARGAFLPMLFETVSAVGTVGLSMGVTPGLSDFGRLLLVAAMFIGRVGPLAFFVVISVRGGAYPSGLRPAVEDMIVG